MNLIVDALKFTWGLLNSAFVIAFVGGLTGALGGALGAQHIIERTNRRAELLRELRNTNAAIMIGFSIVNAALALKKQHVQPMYEQFAAHKAALAKFNADRAAGQLAQGAQFPFVADLRSFPHPILPIETLKGLLFEKISAQGRALALLSVIEQSLVGVREAVLRRDALTQRFQSGEIPNQQVPFYYFGLPLPSGTNQEYPDLIAAIHEYLDDLGFFAVLLCEDLVAHGESVRTTFTEKFGKDAPKVSTVDFSGPREAGLLPPEANYADWLKGFTTKDKNEAVASEA
jgi:hypothetical protein